MKNVKKKLTILVTGCFPHAYDLGGTTRRVMVEA
jgi:hypothetical protein